MFNVGDPWALQSVLLSQYIVFCVMHECCIMRHIFLSKLLTSLH